MKRVILIVFLFFILLNNGLYARLLNVKQDGSGDYITIQAAVNDCENGDTVLVYPGIYFENLEISELNITLASLNIISGEEQYKYNTIIDGGSGEQNPCIRVLSVDDFMLQGFTLQHGRGRKLLAGGTGGGLFISNSTVSIVNCVIKDNFARYDAGGIYSASSNLFLSGTTIRNNHAATSGGGGLVFFISDTAKDLTFDTLNLCSIYNNHACFGADILLGRYVEAMTIKLDTFSVSQAGKQHLYSYSSSYNYPSDIFYLTVENYVTESVNADVFVSPLGDDTNSGLNEDAPLKSITQAINKIISDSTHINKIHLASGTYSKLTTGEYFPLGLWSNTSIVGQSRSSTILDAENFTHHFSGRHNENRIEIRDLSLINGMGDYSQFLRVGSISLFGNDTVLFKGVSFNNNTGYGRSSLSLVNCSQVEVEDVVFENNIGGKTMSVSSGYYAPEYPRLTDSVFINNTIFKHNIPNPDSVVGYGGALLTLSIGDLDSDSLIVMVTNSLFVDNISDHGSFPSSIVHSWHQSKTVFTNCTFANNYSNYNQYSSAFAVSGYYGKSNIYNSIFYNNYPREIYLGSNEDTCLLSIYNSCIEGGYKGIGGNFDLNILYYDSSNIDANPLFLGMWEHPYQITDDSPCIDKGDINIIPDFIVLPEYDLAGKQRIYGDNIDIGAYEWDPTIVGLEPDLDLNDEGNVLSVYPNPFKSQLNIEYNLPMAQNVELHIYNSKGQEVEVLKNTFVNAGISKLIWLQNKKGLYYVVMIAGSERYVCKVISL